VVCASRRSGALHAELQEAGIPVYAPLDCAEDGRWRAYRRVRAVVEREQIRLIHAHMSESAILAAGLSTSGGPPFLVTHHSNRLFPVMERPKQIVWQRLARWACMRAALNLAITPQVMQRLGTDLSLSSEKLQVVRNGVVVPDTAILRAAARRREGASSDWPIIVTVGRLIKIKGQDQLIAAMPLILSRFPRAKLLIAGDGEDRDRLIALVTRQGLGEHIIFAGTVADTGALLASADLYVSTSHYEGLPTALLEAMSWCLPVVVSDVPGNDEIVSDSVNGLTYPLGDVAALAAAVVRLADDHVLAARLAVQGRALVTLTYSAAAMARAHEEIYERLLT
jgi:glycosyltransferase involved in cell wall biosynthesis